MKMVERWREKTTSNPLAVDLYAQEELRRQRAKERERLRKIDQQKLTLVTSMTGKDLDDVVTPERMKSLDPGTKLALSFRSMYLDEKVIQRERSVLCEQLQEQLVTIIDRFPPLDHVNQSRFPGSQPMSELRGSLTNSIKAEREFNSKKSPVLEQSASNILAQQSSSIDMSALEYVSPTKQVQTIEDDISLQFKLSPLQP
jgi:hypothetical protein